MSFILDALKKSETDRQQQGSADFADVPTSSPPPAVPKWLWVVGVLLAVNLAVLIGLLMRPDNSSSTQSASPSTNVDMAATVTREATQESFKDKVAVAKQNPPEQQSISTLPKEQESSPDTVKPVLISQSPASVPAEDLYPTFDEMRVNGSLDLPDLHIDIHVFSPKPEDRFVFINMSKLREGEQLAEGPVVAEITPSGVVLGYQGQFFVVLRD